MLRLPDVKTPKDRRYRGDAVALVLAARTGALPFPGAMSRQPKRFQEHMGTVLELVILSEAVNAAGSGLK